MHMRERKSSWPNVARREGEYLGHLPLKDLIKSIQVPQPDLENAGLTLTDSEAGGPDSILTNNLSCSRNNGVHFCNLK